jgi:hypothetical protein
MVIPPALCYAYGDIVNHLFGAGAGQPALYAVVAIGAVFTSAAAAAQLRRGPGTAGPEEDWHAGSRKTAS